MIGLARKDGWPPDVGVESPRCEVVVTPYEWGVMGVVWEESPEVGAVEKGFEG